MTSPTVTDLSHWRPKLLPPQISSVPAGGVPCARSPSDRPAWDSLWTQSQGQQPGQVGIPTPKSLAPSLAGPPPMRPSSPCPRDGQGHCFSGSSWGTWEVCLVIHLPLLPPSCLPKESPVPVLEPLFTGSSCSKRIPVFRSVRCICLFVAEVGHGIDLCTQVVSAFGGSSVCYRALDHLLGVGEESN